MHRLLVAIAFVLPSAAPLMSQSVNRENSRSPVRVWGSIGIIGAESHEESRLGSLLQLGFQKPPHHFTLRNVWLTREYGPGEVITELGVTYGRTLTGRWGHVALHGGIVRLHFDVCPGAVTRQCNSVGMPVVADAALGSGLFGLGLQAHGNVNPKEIYGGLAIVVYFGWMP